MTASSGERNASLGSVEAWPGEKATVKLIVPNVAGNKTVNITYDSSNLKLLSVSGDDRTRWQSNATAGEVGILLPDGCTSANLTFELNKSIPANDTIHLNITGISGFAADRIFNGSIRIAKEKRSPDLGFLGILAAMGAGAWVRRRRTLENMGRRIKNRK